jgi:hypothetical protein
MVIAPSALIAFGDVLSASARRSVVLELVAVLMVVLLVLEQ